MPNDPSEDLKQITLNQGVGSSNSSNDWFMTVGIQPDSPDRNIRFLTLPGGSPNPKWLLDEPSAEVTIRGKKYDYNATYNKAQDVKDALLGIADTTVNNTRYVGVLVETDIQYIGNDEANQRPEFLIDFRVWREPSSSTLSQRTPL